MPTVSDHVWKVRSKNAGPFWFTVDIFCGDAEAFATVSQRLTNTRIARLFKQPESSIKRFDMVDLHVVKFSLPRPLVQGHRFDRDSHGAQWAVLVAEMAL